MTTSPAGPGLLVASSDRSRPERPALAGTAPADGELRPDGIWHGYPATASRTLCGRPLFEMYLWPARTWPLDAPTGAACYACELVAAHQD